MTLSCKLLIYILPVQQIYRNTAVNVNGTSFSKRIIWIKTLPIIWPAFELFATMIFSSSDRHSKFILNVQTPCSFTSPRQNSRSLGIRWEALRCFSFKDSVSLNEYGILLKRLIGCRWITWVFVVIYFVMYKWALYLIYMYVSY